MRCSAALGSGDFRQPGLRPVRGAEELGTRPAVPAVVAFQKLEDDDFYPGLIALSRPVGRKDLAVQLSRLGGEVVYTARGTVKGRASNSLCVRRRRPESLQWPEP